MAFNSNNTGTGAGAGFLAGGPVGAVVGGLLGAGGLFNTKRESKSRQDFWADRLNQNFDLGINTGGGTPGVISGTGFETPDDGRTGGNLRGFLRGGQAIRDLGSGVGSAGMQDAVVGAPNIESREQALRDYLASQFGEGISSRPMFDTFLNNNRFINNRIGNSANRISNVQGQQPVASPTRASSATDPLQSAYADYLRANVL